jgi:hypothetical protein
MPENGDLVKVISKLLDEKLEPIKRDIVEIRTISRGISSIIGRIEVRLMVVEALVGIDPDKPKH